MTRIAIIGTGNMGNQHAEALRTIRGAKLTACCDVAEDRAASFAERWGVKRVYTDFREMLKSEELDAVYNITIDAMHAPISLAAIDRGIAVLCEKPLATTLADAKKMRDAATRRGVVNMVNFSYRNSSGLQAAAAAIAAGTIGRVIHVEASYLQSWLVQSSWGDWRTDPSWSWRLSTRHGSVGVLGEIGCHIYDFASFLCGDISAIYCDVKTFDKGVTGNRLGEFVLDANDSFVSTVNFANGAVGTVHATRWATGHKNSVRARVYGDKGAVDVDLDRGADEYRIVAGERAVHDAQWETVTCTPTPTNSERFLAAVRTRRSATPDFGTGVKVQAYLHYSLLSNEQHRRLSVKL